MIHITVFFLFIPILFKGVNADSLFIKLLQVLFMRRWWCTMQVSLVRHCQNSEAQETLFTLLVAAIIEIILTLILSCTTHRHLIDIHVCAVV